MSRANSHSAPTSRRQSIHNLSTAPQLAETQASIVLIGIRGTGKSSLAVIASSALGFRVIDADDHFFRTTGSSRAAYNAKHGIQEYKQCELRIMRSVLSENQHGCIITCGPGSVEGEGRVLLEEYAKTHPVIYVLRDSEDIQRHLRAWDAKTISDLITLTAPAYRASSSFEFYNISESRSPGSSDPPSLFPTLTLKNLQHDFLRLLNQVTKRSAYDIGLESGGDAGHIISMLPPESKQFTYSLTLSLSEMPLLVPQLADLQTNADAVRLIIDSPPLLSKGRSTLDDTVANNISKYFYLVRRCTCMPVIIDVALPLTKIRRGNPKTSALWEKAYFALLRFTLRLAPEYICVDMTLSLDQIKDLLRVRQSTKVIGCFFDEDPGVDGWSNRSRVDTLQKAEDLGFDLIWISQEAKSPLDNAAVQSFVHKSRMLDRDRPALMAFNLGPLGRMSCWQNSILTPVTHSRLRALRSNLATSPLLTIPEAQNALYSSFTFDKLYFGVVGSKVSNSVSPAAHNAGYKFYGMPHEYRFYQHSSMSDVRHVFNDESFGGASISSPFKQEIIAVVDYLSPSARAIGAVNTLIPLRGDNKDLLKSLLERNHAGPITGFYGECTDWISIHRCVSRNLSPANAVSSRTTAVVLGAGGMARAAIYSMIRLGVRTIMICNRTVSKAQEVADHYRRWSMTRDGSGRSSPADVAEPSLYGQAYDRAAREHSRLPRSSQPLHVGVIASLRDPWPANIDPPTIVVSTLPGRNFSDKVTIDQRVPHDWLASPTGGVIAELAYDPYETPLLKQASAERHRGWISVHGLQLSLEQAAPQFELFTGRKAPKAQMKAGLMKGYEKIFGNDRRSYH